MSGTTGANPKLLLSITGAVEAATGFLLLAVPSMLVELLLGEPPGSPAGITVARVTGAALLALGIACWLACEDAASRAAKGLIVAVLLYNVTVVAVLVIAWTEGLSGIGLWPVVLAHALLAAWCVACLVVRARS
ncbi:hypothetical protein AB4144_31240 [Rhizobiaceae sp. 2RAB30]